MAGVIRRRETNAGISDSQWNSFSLVWIARWKPYFYTTDDDLAYTDQPDAVPDHHKMWLQVFRDSLSDALEFNTRASHLQYESWSVLNCKEFFATKVQLGIGLQLVVLSSFLRFINFLYFQRYLIRLVQHYA
jgi:hypothetical protein